MDADKVVNNYRIVVSGTEFTAPECRRFHLQGECAWVPEGGKRYMTSSPIVGFVDDIVITRSGSRYVLGTKADDAKTFQEMLEAHTWVPLS